MNPTTKRPLEAEWRDEALERRITALAKEKRIAAEKLRKHLTDGYGELRFVYPPNEVLVVIGKGQNAPSVTVHPRVRLEEGER